MRAEALCRYGDLLAGSAPPPPFEPLVPWSAFLIARADGQAVGCAGLWPMEAGVAEIQRVFVAAPFRRRGIARRLLVELERRALGFGFQAIRLATGIRQPEAIALYESLGFRRIASYGCHTDDRVDICFEKRVTKTGTVPPYNG